MKKISKPKTFLVSDRKLINKLPKFNFKFSNKIYDNHQKMIILVFRQKMRMTYRSIVKFFRFSVLARALSNLKNVPNHSTLVKFHKRIEATMLGTLLCKKKVNTSAIGAYEFETNYRIYHYANVWNRQDKRKYRRYLKISIAICTASQYVLSQKIRKHINHNYVVIDKGYDSKSNR